MNQMLGLGVALLLSSASIAHAQGVVTGAAPPASLAHKQRFVDQLLSDSPIVRRIQGSGHREAIQYLESAHEQRRIAQERLQAGQFADAEKALNDALLNAGRARQLVPENVGRVIADQVRFARLLTGVESLRSNYERHLRQRGAVGRDGIPEDEQLERVDALMQDARDLANAERLLDASRALENAEHSLLLGLNRVLGNATLRYAERFDNPADEFTHESQRNLSYAELVPVAIHEFRPDQDALRQLGRLVERHRSLRSQAEEMATRKDWRGALRAMRAATAELQRALSVAGLQVPRDTTSARSD